MEYIIKIACIGRVLITSREHVFFHTSKENVFTEVLTLEGYGRDTGRNALIGIVVVFCVVGVAVVRWQQLS